MSEHPESRLAWLQLAKGPLAYCAHCDQPCPCDEGVARHQQEDDEFHRWACIPAGHCFLQDEHDLAAERAAR